MASICAHVVMRYLLTTLTIAALLVCPYGCLAGIIGSGVDQITVSACCAHCCHESSTDGDPVPAPEGRFPQSCLCKGALADTVTFEPLPPFEDHLAGPDGTSTVRAAKSWLAAPRQQSDHPLDHGGGLRIVLQSLLC